MSNRREAWKLLYQLVSRNDVDSNDVFAFVDDILCKEPSLIRPHSTRELNNRFQDTFVLWLINKFVRCLNQPGGESLRRKNINLQQKIFSSCFVNRTLVFERLVNAFLDATEQLVSELNEPANDDQYFQISAFKCDDLCLREIDANFSFQDIDVAIDDVDACVQALLDVLRHAVSIGYEVYPQLFTSCIRCVFKLLKECDLATKLVSLRFCESLFKSAHELNDSLEHCYELMLQALALMWEQLPTWLQADCVLLDELDAFTAACIGLLGTLGGLIEHLQSSHGLLLVTFNMLNSVAEIGRDLRDRHSFHFEILIENLANFMLSLQFKFPDMAVWSKHQNFTLLSLIEEHPKVLRLVAASKNADLQNAKYFMDKVVGLLGKEAPTDKEFCLLEELLLGMNFLEHNQRQQKQLALSTKSCFDAETANLFKECASSSSTLLLNTKVGAFLSSAERTDDFKKKAHQIRIVGLLLQTVSVRSTLGSQLTQRMIGYIEKPVRAVLSSTLENDSNERELAYIALQTLCEICIAPQEEHKPQLQRIVYSIARRLFVNPIKATAMDELRRAFCGHIDHLVFTGIVSQKQVLTEFMASTIKEGRILSLFLKSVYCTNDPKNCHLIMRSPYASADRVEMVCLKCNNACASLDQLESYMRKQSATLVAAATASDICAPQLPSSIKRSLIELFFKDENFCFVGNHLDLRPFETEDVRQVLCQSNDTLMAGLRLLCSVVPKLIAANRDFLKITANLMMQLTIKKLQSQQRQQQLQMLQLIGCCASSDLSELWHFQFFKMSFFYLLHPDSKVVNEAVLCAKEMCAKRGLLPTQLWNWYKRNALELVVKLIVFVYLRKGVRLTRSLAPFTKMLGFSCVQEFVCRYYRLLTTILLPYCFKQPRCAGLISSISRIIRKPLTTLFEASFLRIYTHIYLTEAPELGNKCIELIVRCTNSSLEKLMTSDVKQTVSECLIYFNRNPKFVMQAFQCLLLHEDYGKGVSTTSLSATSSSDFAKFIADRFLGVITYFQTCLADPNFEKPLKEEALYSLGQIMRFVGSDHVTQFRFKIIAMLSFVLTLQDSNLQCICLKIWNIFLHVVDIEQLGPSLSRIVASLQPLLQHKAAEVNAIYEFLIIKNDNLLGAYVPDLYFLEHMEGVSPAISRCVARQTELLNSRKSTLLEKITFLYKQITNEHLQVRIYGLLHLRSFFAANRSAINQMVLNEIRVNPLIENVVDTLVAGCRHEDRNLQLASAKCLGELGAIDPSYMPFNYSFELAGELSLSVHTDDFAIKALTELCRGYQFQKDTKYVDNFSLAIQETLSVCGISPKENKKVNIWEALPLRMRQIMAPLLNSCYTSSRRERRCKEHPIFNSSFAHTYEDWAFACVSLLIDFVRAEDTKHLLRSYKPSMKRDNNTLAFFFPYILMHALQDCSEQQMQQVYEEFQTVFSFSSRGDAMKPENETTGFKEFVSTKYSVDRGAESAAGGKRTVSIEQYEALQHITRTCTKLCSEQIDFLQRWVREWQRINIVGGQLNQSGENYRRIESFLAMFDKQLIAKANYNSGEFTRALRYLEEYIEEQPKVRLQEQISFLIEIHGNLMDADSVEGAVYMKNCSLSLAEEILVNRIVDRPQEMMTCYEQLMSSGEQIHQEHIKGMINCYLRMETPETALLLADGLWQKLSDQYTDDYFKECKSELLWRLARYDELEELLEDSVVRKKTTNWNVQCAEAFLLYRQGSELEQFVDQLDAIRSNVLCTMRTCSVIKQNSYPHLYDDAVKLHLLNEVEKTKSLLSCITTQTADKSHLEQVRFFFDDWDARFSVLQPTVRVMEPVLCFRRNLLMETKRLMEASDASTMVSQIGTLINAEVGKLWIRSVQMNREAGCLQQAQLSIMKAAQYEPKTLFIEKAKLLWEKGDQTNTFKLIDEHLERLETKCKRNKNNPDEVERALYAELKFLQATYNAKSMNICSEVNLRYFKEAIAGNRQSEKCHVQLALYMEKIYESFSKDEREGSIGRKLILDIMLSYAKSLKWGFENVYQSLPRLLSYWLDFTSQYASLTEEANRDSSLAAKVINFGELAAKMNDLIENCSKALPISLFYTAFSQLLSRICHPSMDVFYVLRTIIIKLIEHFPQQSLWMLLPIFKSSQTNRIKRCQLIFADERLARPNFQKVLNDFNMLAERLIELTNKEVSLDCPYVLSTLVKQLPKLFQNPKFTCILLPFEKYMQASFPIVSASTSLNLNSTLRGGEESSPNLSVPSNPFPYQQIYICGINEEITVLRSAAKPKKITIRCTDGNQYEVMVKPKDDLRKDFRLMEFNGLVKRYLHQDPQARYRRLRIRTYAAIPFNEECGLVEWLPKLNSFRSICNSIYRTRGLGLADRLLRQCALPKSESMEKKRSMFLGTLVAQHPPVFQEWFRQRFPTPHSWYEARCAYVKTVAVMSMVGYILGLGDRHGENVLFDETNGDAVHVDFNCLFNLGESFAYPEVVPFRLTHNMVFAMGPLGVEGMFRRCCEITLRLLKQEAQTLMSVLRPFVYDYVALNRMGQTKKPTAAELTDPKATSDVNRIKERLQGYVKKTLANSMPLSNEGQVNFLIKEATDIDNLAAMYIGWGAYM